MNFKLLGRSGLRVSELCLGTMTFGEDWGWGSPREESRRVFDAYVAAGGNFLDTADGYTNGTSERLVGEFVGGERQRFVIATKFSFNVRPGDPNAGGNHRKNIVQALEGSLRRLGTDYVDLYWMHAWDQLTPAEEVMRALDDLVRAGKVLYVGVSDTPAWVISYSNAIAQLRGWSPFVALQIEYSLVERTPERELLPMARALGLGFTPWSPLAGGLLTGKYSRETGKGTAADGNRLEKAPFVELSERNFDIADRVKAVAGQIGRSPAQVALRWVLDQYDAIPILGARTLKQLEDNLACLDLSFTPEQRAGLDEISAVRMGFPHEFLSRDLVRQNLHGGTWDRIAKPAHTW